MNESITAAPEVSADKTFDRKDTWFPVPAAIFEDGRYQKIVGDPLRGWTWMRMCHAADRAWPSHPPVPRWVRQPVLDDLVGAGIVELLANDTYAVPHLDVHRTKVTEGARKAGKASAAGRNGAFTQPTPVPTAAATPVQTSGPTTETNTETKTDTETGETADREHSSLSSTRLTSGDTNDFLEGKEGPERPTAASTSVPDLEHDAEFLKAWR